MTVLQETIVSKPVLSLGNHNLLVYSIFGNLTVYNCGFPEEPIAIIRELTNVEIHELPNSATLECEISKSKVRND